MTNTSESSRVLLEQLQGYLQHKPGCSVFHCATCGYREWLHDAAADLDEVTCRQRGQSFVAKTDCTCGLAALLCALPQTGEPKETADGGALNGPSRLGASPEDRIQGAKSAVAPSGDAQKELQEMERLERETMQIHTKDEWKSAALRALAASAQAVSTPAVIAEIVERLRVLALLTPVRTDDLLPLADRLAVLLPPGDREGR